MSPKINANTKNKGQPPTKQRNKPLPLKIQKVAIVNKLVREFPMADEFRQQEILWGDKSDKFVLGKGLIFEFEKFHRMYADFVRGAVPERITSHGRQMILLRNFEMYKNPSVERVISQMDKEELFHEMIFLFIEAMLQFDPDRMHKRGNKKIHFVGYIQYTFKFIVQKWIQQRSKYNKELLTKDDSGLDIHSVEPQEDFSDLLQNDTGVLGLEAISRHIDNLSLMQKQILSMRYIKNLSCQVVADSLSISVGKVISETKLARRSILLSVKEEEALA